MGRQDCLSASVSARTRWDPFQPAQWLLANDLGGQLVKANETLKAIEKNLVPQTLG